jgi:hypothetical protein
MKCGFVRGSVFVLVVLLFGSGSSLASSISDRWEVRSIDSTTAISDDDISVIFKPSTEDAYVCYYDQDNKKIILASQSSASNVWSYLSVPNQSGVEKKYCSIYYNRSVDRLNVSYYQEGASSIVLAQRGSTYLWENKTVDVNTSRGFVDSAFMFYDKYTVPIVIYSIKSSSYGATYFYRNTDYTTNTFLWEEHDIGIKFTAAYPMETHSYDNEGKFAYSYNDELKLQPTHKYDLPERKVLIFDNNGSSPSLAFDKHENCHIAYYNDSTFELIYGYDSDTGEVKNCGNSRGTDFFKCIKVDNAGTVTNLALTIDHRGYPVIAYQDASDTQSPETLNVARPIQAYGLSEGNCGPKLNSKYQWQCDTIDDGSSGGGGHLHEADHISIAVSDSGMIMISYSQYDDYYDTITLKSAQLKDTPLALPAIYYLLQ